MLTPPYTSLTITCIHMTLILSLPPWQSRMTSTLSWHSHVHDHDQHSPHAHPPTPDMHTCMTQTETLTPFSSRQVHKHDTWLTQPPPPHPISKHKSLEHYDHVDEEVLCLVVKKLRRTRIWPMPIRMMMMDSPTDQNSTRSFKSSANARPWASRSRKWVWRSRTRFSSSNRLTADVSICKDIPGVMALVNAMDFIKKLFGV